MAEELDFQDHLTRCAVAGASCQSPEEFQEVLGFLGFVQSPEENYGDSDEDWD